MKFITLENSDKFNEFYEKSALTFVGMIPEEAQLYVDYFKENNVTVNEEIDGYIYTGKMMNEKYHLTGENAYPEDLHILTIPTEAFDPGVCTVRFGLAGRWFDDIVDNKKARESNS